jgi:hypothetical protein
MKLNTITLKRIDAKWIGLCNRHLRTPKVVALGFRVGLSGICRLLEILTPFSWPMRSSLPTAKTNATVATGITCKSPTLVGWPKEISAPIVVLSRVRN